MFDAEVKALLARSFATAAFMEVAHPVAGTEALRLRDPASPPSRQNPARWPWRLVSRIRNSWNRIWIQRDTNY